MAAEIKVGVGADITDLNKGLKAGEKSIKTFAGSVDKIDLDGKLKGNSERAGRALTDLGRVASDLPFGFVAIQNNLTPLVESFGRFSSQSGSFKDTLKSLGSALAGPAGIAFAFSAVSSAITYLAQHPEKLDALLGTLIKTTDAATAAQNAYRDSLAESTSSVQGEIANINSLLSVARNEQLSREARLEAVNKLNKEYPELNNQIKLEGINSKETTDLVNKLNNALITRAKIQAVQELIGAAFKKQVEAQNTALQSQATVGSKVLAFLQLANPLTGAFAANSTLIASGSEQSAKALKESNKALAEYQKILNGLNTSLAESGNLFDEIPPKVNKATAAFKAIKELPKLDSIKVPGIDNSEMSSQFLDLSGFQNAIKANTQPILDDATSFNDQLGFILSQGTMDALSGFGLAIGSALAKGDDVLKAVGQSLLGTVGSVLVQLGKLAIEVGIGIKAIKTALKTLNPAVAVGAGIALIALGSYFTASASNIGNGGSGGGGQSFSPSVPSGFQASAPAGSRAIPREDIFIPSTVIKGTDIVVSYNRQTALNGRTG